MNGVFIDANTLLLHGDVTGSFANNNSPDVTQMMLKVTL